MFNFQLTKLAKKLKKEKVNVDIVLLGDNVSSEKKCLLCYLLVFYFLNDHMGVYKSVLINN